jgi:glycosyltransferase involved in cell wall biosynthesis
MKLLVFAHTPPPHHGQSYMVQLMLNGFGGDCRPGKSGARDASSQPLPGSRGILCYHVNSRVSRDLEDVGSTRYGKIFLILGHCLEAIWCRYRYGVRTLYYVPAPGKAAALYRDWLVMAICRPFFDRVVFHWHATNLSKWLEMCSGMTTRRLTYRFLKQADLSIVLSKFNRFNAEKLWPRRVAVVPNGIPDPCPEFETLALPRRRARLLVRKKLLSGEPVTEAERSAAGERPEVVRVLYLAHCTREKGVFDAALGVLKANLAAERQGLPLRFHLTAAGTFQDPAEKLEFDAMLAASAGANAIQCVGFVQGAQKTQALLDADLLCFPSHWENQPVTVIESMAFGLPLVISRLPSVQEMLPEGYSAVAEVADGDQTAAGLFSLLEYGDFEGLRRHFLTRFTLETYYANMAEVLRSVDPEAAPSKPVDAAGLPNMLSS